MERGTVLSKTHTLAELIGAVRLSRELPGGLASSALRLTCRVALGAAEQARWLEVVPPVSRIAFVDSRSDGPPTGTERPAYWFSSSDFAAEADVATMTISATAEGIRSVRLAVNDDAVELEAEEAAHFADVCAYSVRMALVGEILVETEEIVERAVILARELRQSRPDSYARIGWETAGLCITYYAVLATLMLAMESLVSGESCEEHIAAAELLGSRLRDQSRSQWLLGGHETHASDQAHLRTNLDWAEAAVLTAPRVSSRLDVGG